MSNTTLCRFTLDEAEREIIKLRLELNHTLAHVERENALSKELAEKKAQFKEYTSQSRELQASYKKRISDAHKERDALSKENAALQQRLAMAMDAAEKGERGRQLGAAYEGAMEDLEACRREASAMRAKLTRLREGIKGGGDAAFFQLELINEVLGLVCAVLERTK